LASSAVVEILKGARALIAAGWCQGESWSSVDGRDFYCALGALRAVAGLGSALPLEAGELMRARVGPYVSRWNDDPVRTQAEVLALFDALIADG
jgi:hypothetical protein